MTDYIKREDAIKAVIADAKLKNLLTGNCENEKAIEGMVYEVLCPRDVPSADVVEVVRCKDCKWRNTIPRFNVFLSNGCRWHESESPDDDDFCSYGERKDEV